MPTTTMLALSTPVVDFGNEQVEVFTVTVAAAGGTPSGTVVVESGNGGPLCQLTLGNGAGSCSPVPTGLPLGTWAVMAQYQGDGSAYDGSFSPPQLLTVDAAGTVVPPTQTTGSVTGTTLANAPATVTYGAEGAEVLTVTVTLAGVGGGTGTDATGTGTGATTPAVTGTGTPAPAIAAASGVAATTAAGGSAVFTVDGVRSYSKASFPDQAVFGPVPFAGLRLITYGGTFDGATGQYLRNVVV